MFWYFSERYGAFEIRSIGVMSIVSWYALMRRPHSQTRSSKPILITEMVMRLGQQCYKFLRTVLLSVESTVTTQFLPYDFQFVNTSGRVRRLRLTACNEILPKVSAALWFKNVLRSGGRMLVTCALLFFVVLNFPAHGQELDTELNESVLMIPKKKLFTINLETTLYKPDGAGPFPVVVINHGKTGQARDQERFRPSLAARYFLQRGYAVVAPMRQGFSKSDGNYSGSGCDAESNGAAQADDVKAALDYVVNQPWADKNQLLVAGQSMGGWTSLAFGVKKYPGVKGLINFAGGISNPNCAGWESSLAAGAAAYAKGTEVPSLWFYGDNDSYFSTATYRAMYDQYQAAGGKARLVAFGVYQKDSHTMFGERGGAGIWQPEVTQFLKSLGMPSAPSEAYAKFGETRYTVPPSPSRYAELADVSKIPYVRDTGRAGYKEYLLLAPPRAFAIAKNGVWSWSNDGDDPLKRALERCASISKLECKLYSVDNHVVWTAE